MLNILKSTHTELTATRLSEIICSSPITEFGSFIKTLISPGEICTTIDSNGETPFHMAIQRNKMECLQEILELDIDINSRNNKGYTPLHYALLYGHIKIASQFIERGAQVDEVCVRKTGKTLLHRMILINKPESVRLLLENGASVNKCNETGMTPLHMSVFSNNKTSMNLLLEFGAAIDQMNNFDQTALHLAIQMNQSEMSKILINNGANMLMKDKTGKTMLNISVSVGNLEICKQILKQRIININTKEKLMGRSPLHTACVIGCYPMVKLLVDYGANIKQLTRNRKCPIHLASEAGNTEIVRLLRDKSGTLETKTVGRKTPLLLAVDGDHIQLVQYIIKSKGNVNTKDLSGATPLHYASKKGLLPFVKIFVENGADIHAKDKRMKTPLHEAFCYGHDNIANYLIEAGADQNCVDDIDKTPLDYKKQRKLHLTTYVSDFQRKNVFLQAIFTFIWLTIVLALFIKQLAIVVRMSTKLKIS